MFCDIDQLGCRGKNIVPEEYDRAVIGNGEGAKVAAWNESDSDLDACVKEPQRKLVQNLNTSYGYGPNPSDPVAICANYVADPRDLKHLAAGIACARDFRNIQRDKHGR